MPAVTAPFFAAAAILIAAGVAKLARPDDTARALQSAHLPGHRRLVRAGAAAEIVVGVLALAVPMPVTAALVGVAYLAFTGFVLVALRRSWALSSCGCFGRPDSKPGYAHAVLDAGAAGAAFWWAAVAPGHPGRSFVHQPWHGGPLVLVSLVVAGLAYLVWTNPIEAAHQ